MVNNNLCDLIISNILQLILSIKQGSVKQGTNQNNNTILVQTNLSTYFAEDKV